MPSRLVPGNRSSIRSSRFSKPSGSGWRKQVEAFDPDIVRYADYALNGQGKHLRAALVALTAKALGKVNDAHVTVAVIIEMVHLATLVHDDVIDEAEIRRGRPTLAANWSNEIAVLFGDCLFAHALKLAASFPTPDVCRAVAMATNTVCSGEILQTQHRRDFQLHPREVFQGAGDEDGGAVCALVRTERRPERDGRWSGGRRCASSAWPLARPIRCMMIAWICSARKRSAGKSLGTDLAKGKLTLPVLLLWERADAADRARLQELVEGWQADSLTRLAELLAKYETLGASLEIIHQYLDKARQTLRALPASNGRAGLLGLTEYLARQADALGSVPESSL